LPEVFRALSSQVEREGTAALRATLRFHERIYEDPKRVSGWIQAVRSTICGAREAKQMVGNVSLDDLLRVLAGALKECELHSFLEKLGTVHALSHYHLEEDLDSLPRLA
jgi:hypothetical protein